MPGATQQDIDRQLGAMSEQINALRAGQDRHETSTKAIESQLVVIQIQLGRIEEQRNATIWFGRMVTALIGGIAGALGGHIPVPPGAH